MKWYVDYAYYSSIYGSKSIPREDFDIHIRKAQRELDRATTGKLKFAFPVDESAIEAVKDCLCELVNVFYKLQQIEDAGFESMGTVTDSTTGALRGKVVSSVSSGTESISYSNSTGQDENVYTRAAVSVNSRNQLMKDISTEYLSMVEDANGVGLLYSGPYPRRCI